MSSGKLLSLDSGFAETQVTVVMPCFRLRIFSPCICSTMYFLLHSNIVKALRVQLLIDVHQAGHACMPMIMHGTHMQDGHGSWTLGCKKGSTDLVWPDTVNGAMGRVHHLACQNSVTQQSLPMRQYFCFCAVMLHCTCTIGPVRERPKHIACSSNESESKREKHTPQQL